MMAELKPCPFCGGEAEFVGDTQTIKCKNCGGAFIVTNPLISRLEVKEAWNRRVPQTVVNQNGENCTSITNIGTLNFSL